MLVDAGHELGDLRLARGGVEARRAKLRAAGLQRRPELRVGAGAAAEEAPLPGRLRPSRAAPPPPPEPAAGPPPGGRAGSVTPCCLRQATSLARWAGLPNRPRPEAAAPVDVPAAALDELDPLLLPQATITTAAITAPRANEPRRIAVALRFMGGSFPFSDGGGRQPPGVNSEPTPELEPPDDAAPDPRARSVLRPGGPPESLTEAATAVVALEFLTPLDHDVSPGRMECRETDRLLEILVEEASLTLTVLPEASSGTECALDAAHGPERRRPGGAPPRPNSSPRAASGTRRPLGAPAAASARPAPRTPTSARPPPSPSSS